jgi:hypothetical protein
LSAIAQKHRKLLIKIERCQIEPEDRLVSKTYGLSQRSQMGSIVLMLRSTCRPSHIDRLNRSRNCPSFPRT